MLRKFLKYTFRTFLVFLVLLIGFAVYFILAIRIDEPGIADRSAFDNTRQEITPTFYKTKNGWLKQSESGLWELYVQGNGFERGVANGILTKELHARQEDAFISQIKVLVPNMSYLNFLKYFVAYFNRHLSDHITDEYKQEIYGIAHYASDQYDFIGPKYYRILNYHGAHDIGHALQDKHMTVGCTSFSVWNGKSADHKLLVGRNFDFYSGDDFAKSKIVQFTAPTTGYKFATVTWPGFIGACSGMNEKGITVTINAAKSKIPTDAATPIALLAREILQYAKSTSEAIAIARKREVFVSESILVGSASDNKTISIEKAPDKMDVYEVKNTPEIICPNHYQGKEFEHDLANLNNQIESSSQYRKFRLQQLLDRTDTISYLQAAHILRDQRGINDRNIGMTNEKALNQLLAHHAVIFKPQDGLMWVSANPFQCGKFVCYDIHKVFKQYADLQQQQEIYEAQYTIPEDPFLKTKAYQDFLHFKEIRHHIQFLTKAPKHMALDPQLEAVFTASNPESYYTWQILGDYYRSQNEYAKAIGFYEKALTKVVATLKEEKQIRESLEACKHPGEK